MSPTSQPHASAHATLAHGSTIDRRGSRRGTSASDRKQSSARRGRLFHLSQAVEGNRLILGPLDDVDSLADSPGTGRPAIGIEKP